MLSADVSQKQKKYILNDLPPQVTNRNQTEAFQVQEIHKTQRKPFNIPKKNSFLLDLEMCQKNPQTPEQNQ